RRHLRASLAAPLAAQQLQIMRNQCEWIGTNDVGAIDDQNQT
ncbi:MAG: hypothetical protein QOJ37_2757, partial [Pseudonocardiales bacterium]|nr:hypothetical protein [Pseudonocardiales bacterium]